ncbi:MAG: hypothetical protein GTO18_02195 [Anaerolineales bacterium]|nr:hypothetical protein [Anaerolineales bacterium]
MSKDLTEAETQRPVDTGHSTSSRDHAGITREDEFSSDHETRIDERYKLDPELEEAYKSTERALQRMLSAAIAFCDGAISAGQLRAVRELLREQELRLAKLEGRYTPPFVDEEPSPGLITDPEVITAPPPKREKPPSAIEMLPSEPAMGIEALESMRERTELDEMLDSLDQKIARLEEDFQKGTVNAAQYRAIRKHYLEQREVATRLRQTHPESDRWRVVLEEGKTSFLLQLNEAAVRCVAFYDLRNRSLLFSQGEMPMDAEDAVSLLGTFSASEFNPRTGRMVATHADDGTALVLIPGKYTAALVSFTQDPPGWQVRALREVHRNFEAANRSALKRGERRALIFPNLRRFFKAE